MDEKEFVIFLSDIHMGIKDQTVWYRTELHEKYLLAMFTDIINYANQIKEVILLGDIFELWVCLPNVISPKIEDIIASHPNILGPRGKLCQALSALQGRILYIPGDHDITITKTDLQKIKSYDGYTMKFHAGAYIPEYDKRILFTHGIYKSDKQWNVLDHSLKNEVDIVVMGNMHLPNKTLKKANTNYVNSGFMCPALENLEKKPITYGIYDLKRRIVTFKDIIIKKRENSQEYNNQVNKKLLIYGESNEELPKYTFGFSVYDSALEFFLSIQEGVLSKAKELGIEIIKHDERSSNIEMVTGSIDLISKGVNALLITPFNPELLPVIVEGAKKSNIPVIVIDIGTGGTDVAAFIVSDNFGGGIYAGEYAIVLINKYFIKCKNVAIIKVQNTALFALQRGKGFKSVMEENGYNVVAELPANSEEELGYEVMKKILDTYENNLAVVFCENGTMTLGAARAIGEAGKKGIIMLIGFDSGPSIIEGIKNGSIQGTIAQEPFKMGEIGVEIANSIVQGKSVTYDNYGDKLILMEVYLVDENGDAKFSSI
ncbi:MAG TPA: substrate-binding domain-containing protein [Lachnospiraceae bacterium]|nr:substrate-binding domain-containing protein [Lachnospiraceae bacterium]